MGMISIRFAETLSGSVEVPAIQICRSTETYKTLVEGGAEISASIPEGTIRPISHLPSEDIQVAVWRLVESASPANGPTKTVVSKIVRTIQAAIANASPNGKSPGQRLKPTCFPAAELPFLRPLAKLSTWDGFDAALVVSHVESKEHATRIARACKIMIGRCSQLRTVLAERFGLTS